MPSKSELAGLLADRIDRLRGALAALRRSVRDRVAEVVGAAVADAVRDTVRIAPDPPDSLAPSADTVPLARRGTYDPWGGPERDDWADEDDPIDDGGPDAWCSPAAVTPAVPPNPPAPPPESAGLPRLAAAVVVGLRAAAWWLATRPARRGWGCLLAGLAASGAAYALGPPAVAMMPAVAALALAAHSAELAHVLPA